MTTEKNLQNILELIRRDDSIDAPADSIRWASNLFRTRATDPKRSLVRKLVAVLQMEIAPDKPAFGERSASTTSGRQILYRADGNAIDIRIESAKKGFAVRGQILGEDFSGAVVRLSDDIRNLESTAGEMSEFRFDSVPAGQYELTILGTRTEITLKAVDVA